jgi:hypothetical protein
MQTAWWLAGDDVLDDNLVVAHHDALDDQPQDLLLHLERRIDQLVLNPRAEGGYHLLHRRGALHLDHLLAHHHGPLLQALLGEPHPLAPALQLVEVEDAGLVGVEEALILPCQGRALALDPLQLPLRVGGGEAILALLLPQRGEDQGRLAQEVTDVLPDQRLDVALADRPQVAAALGRLAAPSAGALVAAARGPRVSPQPSSAVATDEQAGEQIRVAHLPRRALAIELELALGQGEGLLLDQRRPGDPDPLGGGAQTSPRILGRSPRALGRLLGRVPRPIVIVFAGVEAIGDDLVDGAGRPGFAAVARRDPLPGQPAGDRRHGELVLDQPGEDLADGDRLGLVDDAAAALSRAGDVGVAVGSGPGEEVAGPGGVELPAAAPLLEGGALELGEEAVDLAHQALLGVGRHRAGGEHDGAAGPLQLLDDDVLVGVVAGEPVRRKDQDRVELAAPGRIAQALQGRAVEARAAVAIIDVAMLRGKRQAVLGGVGLEGGDLAGDRALSLLLGGRDPGVEGRRVHRATSAAWDVPGDADAVPGHPAELR